MGLSNHRVAVFVGVIPYRTWMLLRKLSCCIHGIVVLNGSLSSLVYGTQLLFVVLQRRWCVILILISLTITCKL